MKASIDFIVRFPKTILLVTVVITALLAIYGVEIEIDETFDSMILENDPDQLYTNQIAEEFGSDELIIVTLKSRDIFNHSDLNLIQGITRRLEKVKNIEMVRSLTNTEDIRGKGSELNVGPLIRSVPEKEAELHNLKDQAMNNPVFVDNLFSKSAEVTAVVVKPVHLSNDNDYMFDLVVQIREIVREEIKNSGKNHIEYHCSGNPVINISLAENMRRNFLVVSIFISLIVFFLLWINFGDYRGVLLPLICILFTEVWLLGLMSLLGKSISVLSVGLPSLLVVIGVLDAIHIMTEYYKQSSKASSKKQAVRRTIQHASVPCLLTSVTTAAGFCSLGVIDVPALQDFGLFAGFGVMAAFLISITNLPAMLLMLPQPANAKGSKIDGLMKMILGATFTLSRKTRYSVAIGAVVAACLVLVFTRLDVETDNLSFFQSGDEVRVSERFIRHNLAGSITLGVVVDGGREDSLKDPQALKQVQEIQEFLEQQEEIGRTISIVDYLKLLNRAMHENRKEFHTLPETRELVAQYLLLYSMQSKQNDIESLINFDSSSVRISARLTTSSANKIIEVRNRIDQYLKKNLRADLSARVTGKPMVIAKTTEFMGINLLKSFLVAMITIALIMIVQLKSVKLGLLSMIPNLMPTIAILGTMALLDYDFNYANGIMCIILIGVAVDDTIHFINRFRKENLKAKDMQMSIYNVVQGPTGRAILLTSICFFFGLIPLYFSSLAMFNDWGILWQVSMAAALAGDLILLPRLLVFAETRIRR